MIKTKNEPRIVEVLEDVLCDCCGKSLKSEMGNINGIRFDVCGGYDSSRFPDMLAISVDVCEDCAEKWFKTFKDNPLEREQSNDV